MQKIQAESFPAYKKYELERLQKVLKCNPEAEPEAFYECMDGINIAYENSRKKLNESLLRIDNEYEENIRSCDGAEGCVRNAGL